MAVFWMQGRAGMLSKEAASKPKHTKSDILVPLMMIIPIDKYLSCLKISPPNAWRFRVPGGRGRRQSGSACTPRVALRHAETYEIGRSFLRWSLGKNASTY